uniref:Lipocalin/cytosolic fatty-acid binding domain-containing protein n=1 Tax=Amblyomma maculatum TaxID=34609 RepID=G3MRN2_AMBMU
MCRLLLLHFRPPVLFSQFPYVVLEYTSGDNPEFQCLTNKRVQLDMDAKTSTYVWMFKGHGGTERKYVRFHLSAGDAPDKVVFTSSDECQLWVSRRVKDDVPQHCQDQLKGICDVTREVYSKQSCENDTYEL